MMVEEGDLGGRSVHGAERLVFRAALPAPGCTWRVPGGEKSDGLCAGAMVFILLALPAWALWPWNRDGVRRRGSNVFRALEKRATGMS
jgi:hypothetical protein